MLCLSVRTLSYCLYERHSRTGTRILDQFTNVFQMLLKGLLSQRAVTPHLRKLAYDVLEISSG